MNVFRDFNLFNTFISIPYPEMGDESFYFHGFQWINHIYETFMLPRHALIFILVYNLQILLYLFFVVWVSN